MYVLEDNLRVPSGVSYMLENRQVTKRVFADLFRDLDIHPVDSYPNRLVDLLASLSPRPGRRPTIVAAHTRSVQLRLLRARLPRPADGCPARRGQRPRRRLERLRLPPDHRRPRPRRRHLPAGGRPLPRPERVPPGLGPRCARAHAGVAGGERGHRQRPGRRRRRRQGRVLVRARADPLLPGGGALIPNVPTWLCADDRQRSHVLANLDDLVVKPANESGGYGVFVGPIATREEKEEVGGG